jgi:protein-arginine kinase activator protein McsA
MHTPRDELERVPSFEQQQRRDMAARRADVVVCDSCGLTIDQEIEPGRWRHAACPAPELPSIAQQIIDRVRSRRHEGPRHASDR